MYELFMQSLHLKHSSHGWLWVVVEETAVQTHTHGAVETAQWHGCLPGKSRARV